jgi:hypothetical protein
MGSVPPVHRILLFGSRSGRVLETHRRSECSGPMAREAVPSFWLGSRQGQEKHEMLFPDRLKVRMRVRKLYFLAMGSFAAAFCVAVWFLPSK